jgi:pyruvate dehydrogenase E2 component (dihydrolipoyllysine-residue acetyltransferase)
VTQPASAPELSSLKGEVRTVQPDRVGRSIARRSAEIRATVPQLELSADVDPSAASVLAHSRGCSLTAVLVRACARALAESPWANAAYRDGRFELYSRVNVGVTFHSEGRLATPALLDADVRSLAELHSELERLRARARAGELTPPELAGTTFTFSDLGEHPAVHRYAPLVTPPQAAAVAAGAVRPAAVVRDGAVVPGSVLTLSLTCDHRILYGARAAAFLRRIVAAVVAPES